MVYNLKMLTMKLKLKKAAALRLDGCGAGRKWAAWSLALLSPWLLAGCPAAVVGAAAGGAVVANDERTAGSFLEDELIELKTRAALAEAFGGQLNAAVTSYNRRVLLTGQAPSEAMKTSATENAKRVENVLAVFNEMEIGNPSSLTSRASDSVLTARVKLELCRLQERGFSCLDVKVVSEKGVVYLLGLVTKEQAALAKQTARKIRGAVKVVLAFEYR